MDSLFSHQPSALTTELLLLIAKFLAASPCQQASEVLRRELESLQILPKRLDWLGNKHDQSIEELEKKYPQVDPFYLLKICQRVGPLLSKEINTTLLGVPSLLGAGKQSLLRVEKDLRRTHYSSVEYAARKNNRPLLEPYDYNGQHNLVQVLQGREVSASISRSHAIPVKFYSRQRLFCRTLGHLSAVYCLLFDRTGKLVITGADDLLVKIWSAIDGRLLATLRGASAEITDIAVNPENTLLAAGSCDKILRVWSLQSTAPVAVLTGHTGMVTAVHFCPCPRSDGSRYLVSSSSDGSVAFWTYHHPEGHPEEIPVFLPKPIQYNERMRPGQAQMICASFSNGGSFLAAGNADHHVRVYNMFGDEGPVRILEEEAHTDGVDSIQWANKSLRFVSGSKDGTAIVWNLERQRWVPMRLRMNTKLPGSGEPEPEDGKLKLKVTMVGWDLSDQWVITAVNDHSLKVWNSVSGSLVQVLKTHQDEVFVLESHPIDPGLLLSAGHDGQILVWDIIKGGPPITSYYNSIQGQGHGAVFDAKWSPDGQSMAATDSHGHLLLFGFGSNERFRKLPKEMFFHTDYRPLVRDSNHWVLDEQTQTAPHLMPPPFLVDIDGNPHPPAMQRLVPGRQNCRDEQLVPNIIVGAGGEQEVIEGLPSENAGNPRSNIDQMIAELMQQREYAVDVEQQQGGDWRFGEDEDIDRGRNGSRGLPRQPAPDEQLQLVIPNMQPSFQRALFSPRSAARLGVWGIVGPGGGGGGRIGPRRSGDVEGVRQSSGNWQRGDTPVLWTKRILVPPLSNNSIKRIHEKYIALSELELEHYHKEMTRSPEVIPDLGGNSEDALLGRRHRLRTLQSQKRSYRTRASRGADATERHYVSEFEDPDNLDLDSSGSSAPGAPRRRNGTTRSSGTAVRRTQRGTATGASVARASGEEQAGGHSSPESSSAVGEDDPFHLSSSSDDSDSDIDSSDSSDGKGGKDSSSEYSDWTAEAGINLEPPKRSKRKPSVATARRSRKIMMIAAGGNAKKKKKKPKGKPGPTRKSALCGAGVSASTVKDEPEDEAVDVCSNSDSDYDSKTRKSKRLPKKKETIRSRMSALKECNGNSGSYLSEVPEPFRPPEWLSEVIPRKAPYYPQMGDEVVYFKQGHTLYLEAVRSKKVYDIGPKSEPWVYCKIREQELVKVVGIKYEIRPPRLCCLKLALVDAETGALAGDSFTVKYHDMADVLDFLVLRQTYDTAMARSWKPGDRFRCMIDDCWWSGEIESQSPVEDSLFLCFRVRWDNGEYERMSPWDLEPISESRMPAEIGGAVPVLPQELASMLYKPNNGEWGDVDVGSNTEDEDDLDRGEDQREAECNRILEGLTQVMALSVAEPFVAPVDLNRYPTYAMVVEYPIDLSTIKARLENRFYRRVTSIQFDVRYIATNAEKFNEPGSQIVKQARIVTELCLRVIKDHTLSDVSGEYRLLVENYCSSESDTCDGISKNNTRASLDVGTSGIISNHNSGRNHFSALSTSSRWQYYSRTLGEEFASDSDEESNVHSHTTQSVPSQRPKRSAALKSSRYGHSIGSKSEESLPSVSGLRRSCRGSSIGTQESSNSQAPHLSSWCWKRRCKELLDTLWQCEDSEPFRQPVNGDEHPDYYDVVDTPMDLQTVKSNLNADIYSSPQDFRKDMRLIFMNSKNYNTNKRSRIYSMTIRLSALFEEQMRCVLDEWQTAQRRRYTNQLMISNRPRKVEVQVQNKQNCDYSGAKKSSKKGLVKRKGSAAAAARKLVEENRRHGVADDVSQDDSCLNGEAVGMDSLGSVSQDACQSMSSGNFSPEHSGIASLVNAAAISKRRIESDSDDLSTSEPVQENASPERMDGRRRTAGDSSDFTGYKKLIGHPVSNGRIPILRAQLNGLNPRSHPVNDEEESEDDIEDSLEEDVSEKEDRMKENHPQLSSGDTSVGHSSSESNHSVGRIRAQVSKKRKVLEDEDDVDEDDDEDCSSPSPRSKNVVKDDDELDEAEDYHSNSTTSGEEEDSVNGKDGLDGSGNSDHELSVNRRRTSNRKRKLRTSTEDDDEDYEESRGSSSLNRKKSRVSSSGRNLRISMGKGSNSGTQSRISTRNKGKQRVYYQEMAMDGEEDSEGEDEDYRHRDGHRGKGSGEKRANVRRGTRRETRVSENTVRSTRPTRGKRKNYFYGEEDESELNVGGSEEGTDEESDDDGAQPISISSRGRVRKLTARARALLRD